VTVARSIQPNELGGARLEADDGEERDREPARRAGAGKDATGPEETLLEATASDSREAQPIVAEALLHPVDFHSNRV
jgi:hypothetical protein